MYISACRSASSVSESRRETKVLHYFTDFFCGFADREMKWRERGGREGERWGGGGGGRGVQRDTEEEGEGGRGGSVEGGK